jgi:hypothetical protein
MAGWLLQSFADFKDTKKEYWKRAHFVAVFDAPPDAVESGKHCNISIYQVDVRAHQ